MTKIEYGNYKFSALSKYYLVMWIVFIGLSTFGIGSVFSLIPAFVISLLFMFPKNAIGGINEYY